jgi:hypothetical protein
MRTDLLPCDAYRATQENSPEKLEMVGARARTQSCDDIQAENLPCDGCITVARSAFIAKICVKPLLCH